MGVSLFHDHGNSLPCPELWILLLFFPVLYSELACFMTTEIHCLALMSKKERHWIIEVITVFNMKTTTTTTKSKNITRNTSDPP